MKVDLPLLSLAAGVLPEFSPQATVQAASEAGFRACGIWFDPETWSNQTTREVGGLLQRLHLIPLDIEVIWMRQGRQVSDDAKRLIVAGGELSARHVLIVSANANMDEVKHQFEQLCELAAKAQMRAVLEFLMISEVKSLATALDIVNAVNHPAGGVLIDALHLQRCGATPADVRSISPHLLPYAQLCDGPTQLLGSDYQTYLADAVDGRSAPGEDGLPLRELLSALPVAVPLSLEIRSKRYRERFPVAADRARVIREQTERFFQQLS